MAKDPPAFGTKTTLHCRDQRCEGDLYYLTTTPYMDKMIVEYVCDQCGAAFAKIIQQQELKLIGEARPS